MRDAHPELTRRGYTVVAVGQGPGSRSATFAREHELPFAVLGDPKRAGYAAFGLRRASILDIVKPALVIAAVKAVAGGAGLSATDGDPAQRPGTFVIDREGIVRHAHPGAHAGDTPASEELIRAIDALDPVSSGVG